MKQFAFILFLGISMYSCKEDIVVDGMKPIYALYDDFSTLKSESALPFGTLGKIVTVGQYIFINELYKGIHVIDNTDPIHPVNKYFWKIAGNREFTILNNVLYADNGKHLLVIDISDYANIALLEVLKDQYVPDNDSEAFPANYVGLFECYDSTLGILIGWEEGKIINPKCNIN